MQVHFTEEVHENVPKVVHLPVISLSDRAYFVQIDSPPANPYSTANVIASQFNETSEFALDMDLGGLYHLFEVDCDVRSALEDPTRTGCHDLGLVYPYCEDNLYSSGLVESADGAQTWRFSELELQVRYMYCTDLETYNGKVVAKGKNDTAFLCSSFINKTTQCEFHLNATCGCSQQQGTLRCLEPLYLSHQQRLLDYDLKPHPAYTALAALTENFYLLEWLVDLGLPVAPVSARPLVL